MLTLLQRWKNRTRRCETCHKPLAGDREGSTCSAECELEAEWFTAMR